MNDRTQIHSILEQCLDHCCNHIHYMVWYKTYEVSKIDNQEPYPIKLIYWFSSQDDLPEINIDQQGIYWLSLCCRFRFQYWVEARSIFCRRARPRSARWQLVVKRIREDRSKMCARFHGRSRRLRHVKSKKKKNRHKWSERKEKNYLRSGVVEKAICTLILVGLTLEA
jgi:hypothetical protein